MLRANLRLRDGLGNRDFARAEFREFYNEVMKKQSRGRTSSRLAGKSGAEARAVQTLRDVSVRQSRAKRLECGGFSAALE
ncbi:MAG TPA: hypothetical protein VFW05_12745 [Verrucomicrobiae bacterium]|jgi:hypothetical protein|nr:hypothetical protein [Verrucomicrobiae bacterium]